MLAPVVSEKSYGLLDEGKYTFLVRPPREQDRDQDRGREDLRRQGRVGQHAEPPGQDAAAPAFGMGKRKDTKRAIVSAARRRPIDIFGGPVS